MPDFRTADKIYESAFDRGLATAEEYVGVSMTDDFALTEVDGVGPATAEKLKAAGIRGPEQLTRYTAEDLATIEGIGFRKAEQIASQFQHRKTRFETADDREEASEAFGERSRQARTADRSFNAPLTKDFDKWAANPNRYDYPGVDTVPRARRAKRVREKASRLKRIGFDLEVAPESGGRGPSGSAAGGRISVDTSSSWDTVSTVAHEMGHAADRGLAGGSRGGSSEGLFEDEEVREQAERLAAHRRPMLTEGADLEKHYDERDLEAELYADVFAVATEEPRAARRMAPDAVRAVEETALGRIGRF